MGWLKFTSHCGLYSYDTRDPLAEYDTEGEYVSDSQNGEYRMIKGKGRQGVYRYPKGKEIWLDDPKAQPMLKIIQKGKA